jgi:hypothetical protein
MSGRRSSMRIAAALPCAMARCKQVIGDAGAKTI